MNNEQADELSRRMLAAMETVARELPRVVEQLQQTQGKLDQLGKMLSAAVGKAGVGALLKSFLTK